VADRKTPSRVLERDIKFSNATKFRKSLLSVVKELKTKPSRRFIITRGGEPQAVLMSYETYSLLAEMMDEDLKRTSGQTREEAIDAAFNRLRSEPVVGPSQEQAADKSASPDVPKEVAQTALIEEAETASALTAEAMPCTPRYTIPGTEKARYEVVFDIMRAIREHVDELDNTLKDRVGKEAPHAVSEK
jgi:PHD/YefM family antitoxin component YafN of YafNO toxin-antitoxin module